MIRDGDRGALRNPPPRAFTPAAEPTYVHLSENRIPSGTHYVFNCEQTDSRVLALCERARLQNAELVFVVRRFDSQLARYVDHTRAHLIPAYGIGNQITSATAARALGRLLSGHRVVATGALANTTATGPIATSGRHTFSRLLLEASEQANAGARVVAAVLTQPRTGSNFLRDLIGLTVSSRVDVFHEHAIPVASAVQPDAVRSWFDQAFLERDATRARLLRRACLRRMIVGAERRFLFLPERPPDARLTSYFQRRRLAWIRSCFDRKRRRLTDVAAIQQEFDRWLTTQVKPIRRWYRNHLGDPFGLSVLDAEPVEGGGFLHRNGANTLLVVPTASLATLQDELSATFGGREAYESIAGNSVETAGRGPDIARAFRQQVRFPPEVADALWKIPEVARLHPRR